MSTPQPPAASPGQQPPHGAPPAASTTSGKPPLSRLALFSFIIAAFEVFMLLIVRIVASVASQAHDGAPALALTFGILGLVSLVPTVLAIVLGHIAIAQTRGGRRRGLAIAAIGTGIGYVNLLFWGNRVLIAAIAAAQAGGLSQFVPNNFWWA